jgi:hypothetical protein
MFTVHDMDLIDPRSLLLGASEDVSISTHVTIPTLKKFGDSHLEAIILQ